MTSATGLDVCDLTVRFGGLVAVDGISLVAPEGRITGLIGPNGAGKTTCFNACSGLVRAASGRVTVRGVNVTRRSAPVRARLGLGRTFQRLELFDTLTVAENIRLGREAALTARRPLVGQIWTSRRERLEIERATEDAIDLCGLERLASRQAGLLSTGEGRLVELARAVAGRFGIVMLDEPSSGLDTHESRLFGELLQRLAARGVGILLVEHDIALVSRVCEYLYVLDFGRPLIDGLTQNVLNSEQVVDAYLGSAAEASVEETPRSTADVGV